MGLADNDAYPTQSHEKQQLAELDKLADMLEAHLDLKKIKYIIDAHRSCA
jgi:cobyric acid synthase